MANNNHSEMEIQRKLEHLLKNQAVTVHDNLLSEALSYAEAMAAVENTIAVVSDLSRGKSYIRAGKFAKMIGITGYEQENSIWETKILKQMPEEELGEKIKAELRFYHFLRHLPKSQRGSYYLMSKLRFIGTNGTVTDVLHRMYYMYDNESETVRIAVCLYGPCPKEFNSRSIAVNSITGIVEELTSSDDKRILSARERQVLSLIDCGMKSSDISERLNISIHTVSRHRQEILSKLKVKNSIEACRLAKSMELI